MILTGAFAGAMGYHWTENALVGIIMGMIAGLLVSLVQAQMSHRLTADQFVVGLTLNILFLGVTSFLYAEWKPSSKVTSHMTLIVFQTLLKPSTRHSVMELDSFFHIWVGLMSLFESTFFMNFLFPITLLDLGGRNIACMV